MLRSESHVSPAKVAWFCFMESDTCRGNVFVNTVVGCSRAALPRAFEAPTRA